MRRGQAGPSTQFRRPEFAFETFLDLRSLYQHLGRKFGAHLQDYTASHIEPGVTLQYRRAPDLSFPLTLGTGPLTAVTLTGSVLPSGCPSAWSSLLMSTSALGWPWPSPYTSASPLQMLWALRCWAAIPAVRSEVPPIAPHPD